MDICVLIILLFYPAFKKVRVNCFTSVCPFVHPYVVPNIDPSVNPSVPWILFVPMFLGTTLQGFLRDYTGQLYSVIHFQIHHSNFSCLPSSICARVSSSFPVIYICIINKSEQSKLHIMFVITFPDNVYYHDKINRLSRYYKQKKITRNTKYKVKVQTW